MERPASGCQMLTASLCLEPVLCTEPFSWEKNKKIKSLFYLAYSHQKDHSLSDSFTPVTSAILRSYSASLEGYCLPGRGGLVFSSPGSALWSWPPSAVPFSMSLAVLAVPMSKLCHRNRKRNGSWKSWYCEILSSRGKIVTELVTNKGYV